ncbi:MerR family transcriptional regulator [Paenibacillus sp. GCM10027629]|uniref:MerR family transcriptional regulator n=1 Tax=Paenibacillus sp. GCM10027629 TaxID=3273414 RepID=UPI0036441C9A
MCVASAAGFYPTSSSEHCTSERSRRSIYTIGDIINKVNISRRTLHYYDRIDLLKPAIVKDNGYRYYDDEALIKLQTILSLKSMDYPLDQIKALFDAQPPSTGKDDPWVLLLQLQIDYAAQKIEELKRKQFILRGVLQTIQMSGQRNDTYVLELFQKIQSPDFVNGEIPATFPAHLFKEEEIEVLKRLPLIGSDDPRIHHALKLIQETRRCMASPWNPSAVRTLAGKWRDCFSGWFEGNAGLMDKYFALVTPTGSMKPVVFGLDEALIRYVDRIMEQFDRDERKG